MQQLHSEIFKWDLQVDRQQFSILIETDNQRQLKLQHHLMTGAKNEFQRL